MLTLRSILDVFRETALSCIGSPHARSRQLAALRRLDAHLLKDIGLTADEVKRAVTRPGSAQQAHRRSVAMATRTPYANR